MIVISGAEVEVVVLVGDIDVGVVVVGVAVVVTVVVRGAGCWGRGWDTGTSRGVDVTTMVAASTTGATTGSVDVAGAVDTATLLAELAGAVSPSNWAMPKTANAATAATADCRRRSAGHAGAGGCRPIHVRRTPRAVG